ncbi:hypothetical protein [Streptomyces sp. NPDC058268]|uniref:hypothetical protein n=1 Tax=Streptomyces sp. NPDC058268 TaxID=3346413 RepID=UPI0036E08F81
MHELMHQCADGQERSTTVSFGEDGFTTYAHVRLCPAPPGQADVSLASWTATRDTARYFGSNPPGDAETRLPPDGTATPDESLPSRVMGHLATRMNALGTPRPGREGHLTITVRLLAP